MGSQSREVFNKLDLDEEPIGKYSDDEDLSSPKKSINPHEQSIQP